MDCSSFPVVELLSCLCNHAAAHASYLCFSENLAALKTSKDELESIRNDVKRKAEEAEKYGLTPSDHVKWWLSSAEDEVNQAEKLINNGTQQTENNCLGICNPKRCWFRYKLGKKIEKKLKELNDMKEKGAPPVEGTFNRLWRSIVEDQVGIIGLYGEDGVGKTALLTKVSNKLSSTHKFNFVIWSAASMDLNLEKIQHDIAKGIGFLEDRWNEKSQEEKARDLGKVLNNKKYILLLDDISEQVDLTKVGVPPPNTENGSKLVFTTRSADVCDSMGAQEKIQVGCLTWEEAWKLFREKVGEDTLQIDAEIPRLAETAAKMCDGLPLTLIAIARAMASKKTFREWHGSVDALQRCLSEFSGMRDKVFPLLKFSYDNLPNKKLQSCFLYCTLFPEDFSINKSNLIDYWIGEGILGEYGDADEAWNEGYGIIATLVNACLLEDKEEDVKMHSKIRDVALWISCECSRGKNTNLVEAGAKLTEAPEVGKWENVRRISLISNHIQNLTETPRCSNLQTLLLRNNNLQMIISGFFQFMIALRVLDLSENRELTELPSGISKLNSLQHLNLSRTGIRQLTVELKHLVKLKCLNLEHTYQLHTIPMQLISSFSKLNVLRMAHCASHRLVADGIQHGGYEALAVELQCLEHLKVFTVTIRNEHTLHIFLSSDKFQSCTQSLSLHHFKHSKSLDVSFLEGMQCLADLQFSDCTYLEELKIDNSVISRERCFNSLTKVFIVDCSKLRDLSWIALAPNLTVLMTSRCSKMEEIISDGKLGEGNQEPLAKLKVLQLVSLPQLKSIYGNALSFPCLEEMLVDECPKLKKLPLNFDRAKGRKIVIQGREDWWKELKWEDEETQNAFLPCFKASMY